LASSLPPFPYYPLFSSIHAAFQLSQFLFPIASDYIGNYCCYCRLVSYLLLLFRCFCLLERKRENRREGKEREKRESSTRQCCFVLFGAVSIPICCSPSSFILHPLYFMLHPCTLIPATRTVVEIATQNTVIPPPLTYCHFLHFSPPHFPHTSRSHAHFYLPYFLV